MCTRPSDAWKVYSAASKGGCRLTFECPPDGGAPIQVKCNRCPECRARYSYEWAVRLGHENRFHAASCFITLTYGEEFLPADRSLRASDVTKFLKRLRKLIGRFRYFYCGEYGGQRGRPHYHMILFGHDFRNDRYEWSRGKFGDPLFRSPTLEKAWSIDGRPIGHCDFGTVTSQSCSYVAGYALKKRYGPSAKEHYEFRDEFGEVHDRRPEFVRMSLKPGIGRAFFDKFQDEMFNNDSVIVKGREGPIPGYYEAKFKEQSLEHAQRLEDLKRAREARAEARAEQEQRISLRVEQIEAYQIAMRDRLSRDHD